MLFRLLAAFILIPLIELYLLLQLASVTSVPITFGVVVVTGVVGTFLARREGIMAWTRFRAALAEGRVPSREIQDGLMIVFAAALLLTPGLITDAVGFLLLFPPSRTWIRRLLLPRFIGGSAIRMIRFRSFGVRGTGPHVNEDLQDAEDERPRTPYPHRGSGPVTLEGHAVHKSETPHST